MKVYIPTYIFIIIIHKQSQKEPAEKEIFLCNTFSFSPVLISFSTKQHPKALLLSNNKNKATQNRNKKLIKENP